MRRHALVNLAAAAAVACSATDAKGPLTIDEHQALFFPIASGSHAGLTCDDCHGAADSFQKFTCTGCHAHSREQMQLPHFGQVAGYQYDSRSCYGCHPASERVGLNHQLRFPISAGSSHAELLCGSCHVGRDRKQVACRTCHTHAQDTTDPLHAGVADYRWENQACLECHPAAAVALRAVDHAQRFPIGVGTRHAGLGCASCHSTPGDRKVTSCTGCHTHEEPKTGLIHGGVPGYQYTSAACLICHPASVVVPRLDHSLFFPLGGVHAGAACSTCHAVPGTKSEVGCTTACHKAGPTFGQHLPVGGYQHTTAACLRCHGDSQVDRVAAHLPFAVDSGAKHYLQLCLTCHPQTRADKPWAADFNLPRIACAPCHTQPDMDAKHVGRAGYDYANFPSCLASGCHPDGKKP